MSRIDREWKAGDTIELNLPMPVRRVVANSEVAPTKGRVALQRGPLVYTAEWVDNPTARCATDAPRHAKLTAAYDPGC
jgi:DUF1680 family protein